MAPVTHVIIHGHFYQPPRENPWTSEIERQESAAPFHDWNQRITAECYTPNTRSRVVDERGRLLEVINNYAHLSFNFGPTLLSYLHEHHPETYRLILAADAESIAARGHGNAMAQVYNHVIMPLATERDRWTQIQWGLHDFRARFGREAEGMWLAETAVNADTLRDLVRAGMRFVILSPSQAEAWRPQDSADWLAGPPPTDRPFWCATDAGRIAVLLYHAGVSQAVAFEHLLRNSAIFADRIEQAAGQSDRDDERLVLVASDGESYGHHEKLGDMCLAYLSSRELAQRGLRLTNPAAYLAAHPPVDELRLKPGRDGQGTAWSCAHGVERWQSDCGCSDGGPVEWDQAWRAPLRRAFDLLREELDALFERRSRGLLSDPWAARDDYIRVILGKPLGAARAFFEKHIDPRAPDNARALAFRLLEMQHKRMLMYTSCGWFFADLAGLEPIQNMRYAYRALELGRLFEDGALGRSMKEKLAEAQSNLPAAGNGLDIARRHVLPDALAPDKSAAQYALLSLVRALEDDERMKHYRVEQHLAHNRQASGFEACSCRLTLEAEGTQEGGTFDVAALRGSGLRVRVFVAAYSPERRPIECVQLLSLVEQDGFEAACEKVGEQYTVFGLADMQAGVRARAVEALLAPLLDEISEAYRAVLSSHEGLLGTLAGLGVALPDPLRPAVGWAVSARLTEIVERSLDDGRLERAVELSGMTEALGLKPDLQPAAAMVAARLSGLLQDTVEDPHPETIEILRRILAHARRMGLEIDEVGLQVRLGAVLGGLIERARDAAQPGGPSEDSARALSALAEDLKIIT